MHATEDAQAVDSGEQSLTYPLQIYQFHGFTNVAERNSLASGQETSLRCETSTPCINSSDHFMFLSEHETLLTAPKQVSSLLGLLPLNYAVLHVFWVLRML